MADPAPYPDSNADPGDDTGVGAVRGSTTGTPRWVKVSGIIVGVLVLVFLVLQLTGVGGEHGPGRHIPGGNAPADAPAEGPTDAPAQVDDGGHAPPAGGHG
jgi:hypothetical protein